MERQAAEIGDQKADEGVPLFVDRTTSDWKNKHLKPFRDELREWVRNNEGEYNKYMKTISSRDEFYYKIFLPTLKNHRVDPRTLFKKGKTYWRIGTQGTAMNATGIMFNMVTRNKAWKAVGSNEQLFFERVATVLSLQQERPKPKPKPKPGSPVPHADLKQRLKGFFDVAQQLHRAGGKHLFNG